MHTVSIHDFKVGKNQPLTIFTGPCVIEGREHALETAHAIKEMFADTDVNIVYKSSYDKANRSSIHSFRGPGIEKGLAIMSDVKKQFDMPLISDIHTPEQAKEAATILDVIQIPAFLCRQTDLIVAAGETDAVVKVKKGQFMSPWDMANVVEKLRETGKQDIILTDRGTSFGYNNLVSDMRAIPVMQECGVPVCFDASHSVQLPGGLGNASGGQREFIPTLARAAIASGANALFIESHPDPKSAKSDKASVYPLQELKKLVIELNTIYKAVQQFS